MSTWDQRNLLLVAHIAAAILFIGPATVAASLFPRYAVGDSDSLPVAGLLHRLTRVYGTCSLAVPVVGVALAARADLLDNWWVVASILLVAAGLALLALIIVPGQRQSLAAAAAGLTPAPGLIARLRAASGLYAIAWIVVLALMVIKPN